MQNFTRERAARLAYFKELETYEIAKENVFII